MGQTVEGEPLRRASHPHPHPPLHSQVLLVGCSYLGELLPEPLEGGPLLPLPLLRLPPGGTVQSRLTLLSFQAHL